MTRPWLAAGAVTAGVVAADQVTKALVERDLKVGEDGADIGPLTITHAQNEGAAFGLASGGGFVLVVVSVIALGILAWWFHRHSNEPYAWVATGLIAGGAVGNLLDRALAGQVTDFLDFDAWPPFNIADIGITVGVGVLVVVLLREPEAEPA